MIYEAHSFGNVLMYGSGKISFPDRIGLMTGMYSIVMNLSVALASGFSVTVASSSKWNWQFALLPLAFLAIFIHLISLHLL